MEAPLHIRVKPLPIKKRDNPEAKALWDKQRDSVLAVYYADRSKVIGYKAGQPFVKPKFAHVIEIVDKSTFDPHYNRLPHAWTVSTHQHKLSHGPLRLRISMKMLQDRIGADRDVVSRTWQKGVPAPPSSVKPNDWEYNFAVSVRGELTVMGYPNPELQLLFDPKEHPVPALLMLMKGQLSKKLPVRFVLYVTPEFLTRAADLVRKETNKIAAAGGFSMDSTTSHAQAKEVAKQIAEELLQFLRESVDELAPIVATLVDHYPMYQAPLSLIYQGLSANRGD